MSTAVCVLGSSRSGTSLTTRVLSLAGVDLGPERELLGRDLLQLEESGEDVVARARAANPEGFWEHYRIMRLNEAILRALGGSWRQPPSLPPGWEGSERLAGERARARELLDESFAGSELWGWKDPRNSLTLPFWRGLAPNLRCVVCLRNPLDVAASLERRDGIPLADGIALWQRYLASALADTADLPRVLVSYEDHFDDPVGTARRLARFVGRPAAFAGPDAESELRAAIDDRLWRHRTPPTAAIADARAPTAAAGLQLVTELLRAAAPTADRPRTAELHAATAALARRLLAAEEEAQRPATAATPSTPPSR